MSCPIVERTPAELGSDLETLEIFCFGCIRGNGDSPSEDGEADCFRRHAVFTAVNIGKHELTFYGIGYYGFAFQPGLIPIDTNVPNDTYDARQREETSNGSLILNDIWHLTPNRQLQFSGFYRYYTLDVRPNFGDGWIRQSEHRNVNSEDVLYAEHYNRMFFAPCGRKFPPRKPQRSTLIAPTTPESFSPSPPTTSSSISIAPSFRSMGLSSATFITTSAR